MSLKIRQKNKNLPIQMVVLKPVCEQNIETFSRGEKHAAIEKVVRKNNVDFPVHLLRFTANVLVIKWYALHTLRDKTGSRHL